MTILSNLSGIKTENYKKLEALLKIGNFEEADSETARLMLIIGTNKKREIQYLNQEEIKNFPYHDLFAINVLWKYYGGAQCGFTSQASLWKIIIENKHKKQHSLAFLNLICYYFNWLVVQENKLIINSSEDIEKPVRYLPRWSLAIIPGPRSFDIVWKPGLEGLEMLNRYIQIWGTDGNSVKMVDSFYLLFQDTEIGILKDFFSLVGNSKLDNETIKIIHSIYSSQLDQKLYQEFSNIKNSSNISEDESIESTKSEIESIGEQLDVAGDFRPKNREETRKRISRWIAQRRGQPKFRQELLEAYNYRCAITGCNAEEALEAAHIIPYCETEDNAIYNGLLLRADIHTLFDLNLIAIAPGDNYPEDVENLTIHIAPSLRQTSYGELHNNPIKHVPNHKSDLPDKDYLLLRCQQCSWFI
ncbi:GUN4 domain-containing protein [Planktothrix agardhii]|uniref:GUN4 domain-containing protein n=1 Tax=Planktothrix agardhii TaxID=1160 RepID=UPI00040776EA|nr:GUN4 domain-containing protein [Planktothrix agardhii]CAD5937613.1 hypothetical protein NO758_01691 [Planktothrix agardhii]